MTCPKCGCTVFWDCECDPEINALQPADYSPTYSELAAEVARLQGLVEEARRDVVATEMFLARFANQPWAIRDDEHDTVPLLSNTGNLTVADVRRARAWLTRAREGA